MELQSQLRKAAAKKTPVFFCLPHFAGIGNGSVVDGGKQGGDEQVCSRKAALWVGAQAFNLQGQDGVEKNAAANHEVLDIGKPLPKALVVGQGAEVAVVYDFVPRVISVSLSFTRRFPISGSPSDVMPNDWKISSYGVSC